MEYTSEQIRAAYALNLCTVSVSQIIDYDDINIMEHEYEAILNNINIEKMPRDEALLKILKQILDTITFFRIEDGDKKLIEKEYQQKMKNAIWSAVPNIGLLLAGGSPVTMAVSLASQVGIGYMNYRRVRCEADTEKERNRWQLERTAIDQFNGLRRELFDTAWRLENEYDFPDELRLTERQIKQYDAILMDNDLIRRYERLDAIKDKFVAYPPFWYQLGNTANAIAGSPEYAISEISREQYKQYARNHFAQYRDSNKYALLREDQVTAACALEYIDLLDMEADSVLIKELLDEAVSNSGNANDVLQLCALAYLKLGNINEAAKLFRGLVNEQYNTVINSQILSSIYVKQYIDSENSSEVVADYEILKERVGAKYLYELPSSVEGFNKMEADFEKTQKDILLKKYHLVFDEFREKYAVEYGKIMPAPRTVKDAKDSYFADNENALPRRCRDIKRLEKDSYAFDEYRLYVRDREITERIFDLLDEMIESVFSLDIFEDEEVQNELIELVAAGIQNKRNEINEAMTSINGAKVTADDINKFFKIRFSDITAEVFAVMNNSASHAIEKLGDNSDLSYAEEDLTVFCMREKLTPPEVAYGKDGDNYIESTPGSARRFNQNLLGQDAIKTNKKVKTLKKMMGIIESFKDEIVKDINATEFYMQMDPRVRKYFADNKHLNTDGNLRSRTLAVLDDKSKRSDFDLLFTRTGIVPVRRGVCKKEVPYDKVFWNPDKDELYVGAKYVNKAVDYEQLYALCKKLNKKANSEISLEYEILD